MKSITPIAILLQALAAQAVRIAQSNDDGWAELYIRSFNDALNAAGHHVVLSGPAENKSGSSSLDVEPSPRKTPCEFNSCPGNGSPVGNNATRPDLNWVNSFPVTAMRFGIDHFGPELWNGSAPELATTGPNVGTNLFVQVPFSGTVGAAVFAVHERKIPAIAFSGASTGNLAFDTSPVPLRSSLYAKLATQLTEKIIASGKPFLPDNVWLNVNFPKVEGDCTDASKFKWVLSRINPGLLSGDDVELCGSKRLPTELDVHNHGKCFISVSVGDAKDKTTANKAAQAVVLSKLKSMLTCLSK